MYAACCVEVTAYTNQVLHPDLALKYKKTLIRPFPNPKLNKLSLDVLINPLHVNVTKFDR